MIRELPSRKIEVHHAVLSECQRTDRYAHDGCKVELYGGGEFTPSYRVLCSCECHKPESVMDRYEVEMRRAS